MRTALETRIFNRQSGCVCAIVGPPRSKRALLLHGNSSCKEAFSAQVDALYDDGFQVLVPDFPGHGQSDNARDPQTTYSFPGYARAVTGILDDLQWPDYAALGWSLGGHVGLELMGTDPRLQKLMIVGTPPVRPCPEALDDAFFTTPEMSLAGKDAFSDEDARTYVANMLGVSTGIPDDLISAAKRTDGRARAWMIANGINGVGVDAKALVETCRKPLAVVHGVAEAFVRQDYLESLAYASLWRGRIQLFERDGHAAHWTSPRRFNELLLAFLNDPAGVKQAAPQSSSVPLPQ